ncbi:GTPase IMAP family member 7-like [Centropristis striata]|uniref:GTPase IMAP family member 7-like n=1 Tax=Centropristis striata TaxID=184440 RepID=UPI0027DFE0D7|nr:GTPase IMAP family member 7-like [Centropristis striata]
MDDSNKRIVILGKPGIGKSSLANTIFGEKRFRTYSALDSETNKCQRETKSVNGRRITLIDTPGYFDTERPEEELKAEIVRCITECSPGPHAFLIVLKVEKFTEQEQAVITKIKQLFSEEVYKYATVLFTHGDQLPEGQTIMEFVHQNQLLSDVVKKCGGRCHVVDNKYWKNDQQDEYRSNKFQVKELLKTIDEITEANRGGCYTNEMLQAAEEMIQQEEERIRKSSPNMSEEEIREQAKGRVSEKYTIKLAGFTKGALIAAFCGLALSGSVPGVAIFAAVGAVMIGGLIDYIQSEGAGTPQGTAEMVEEAVMTDYHT